MRRFSWKLLENNIVDDFLWPFCRLFMLLLSKNLFLENLSFFQKSEISSCIASQFMTARLRLEIIPKGERTRTIKAFISMRLAWLTKKNTFNYPNRERRANRKISTENIIIFPYFLMIISNSLSRTELFATGNWYKLLPRHLVNLARRSAVYEKKNWKTCCCIQNQPKPSHSLRYAICRMEIPFLMQTLFLVVSLIFIASNY